MASVEGENHPVARAHRPHVRTDSANGAGSFVTEYGGEGDRKRPAGSR